MIYSGLWMLLILSLLNYHLYLLTINLTTNEHINSGKYGYFKDEYNDFNNPFNRGSPILNILDGLFPSKKIFFTRSEALSYNNNNNSSNKDCHDKECNRCDKQKRKNSKDDRDDDIELGESKRLITV